MWIRHEKDYFNLDNVICVRADYSRHCLRLMTVDGDEQLLKLPREINIDEAHRRMTALLSPCEPFSRAAEKTTGKENIE